MEKPGSRRGFILLCLRRGVPPDKIRGFLVDVGVDKDTAEAWIADAKKEMGHGHSVAPTGHVTLEGKTATNFVLPDLDATATLMRQMEEPRPGSDDHALELESQLVDPQTAKIELHGRAPSALVASRAELANDIPARPNYEPDLAPLPPMKSVPLEDRYNEEKQKAKKKKKKRRKHKFLNSSSKRLAVFAAGVVVAWLFSDSGWLPGGTRRGAEPLQPAQQPPATLEDAASRIEPESPQKDAEAAPPAPREPASEPASQPAVKPDPWANHPYRDPSLSRKHRKKKHKPSK
jgi:hypothetical protein